MIEDGTRFDVISLSPGFKSVRVVKEYIKSFTKTTYKVKDDMYRYL